MTQEAFVLHETTGAVATLTLNRPKALNALSPELMAELAAAIEALDADEAVRCIVLTGGPRVFAAGADIKAMAERTPAGMVEARSFATWERIRRCRKPIIAAVSGYALGGGCELAMQCDLIVASETAQFGQPEINIGIMPGAGGTQRLARAIGPYRAMEMVLTGRMLSAREAYAAGLVNRIAPIEGFLAEAQRLAAEIAERAPIAVRLAREALRYGVETTVREGLEIERRNFYLLFDTEDQKEGMHAFVEKRKPEYRGK
ncbi:MAG TPA: enoyl-CoA hydratase-related protein [Roseiflexaceae bacterium]|nr:enoyl-CoA hydratase-related protein [Roseiflexaceae bacterium]